MNILSLYCAIISSHYIVFYSSGIITLQSHIFGFKIKNRNFIISIIWSFKNIEDYGGLNHGDRAQMLILAAILKKGWQKLLLFCKILSPNLVAHGRDVSENRPRNPQLTCLVFISM